VFSAQLIHGSTPILLLYLPLSHSVHGPPIDPYNPDLQLQSGARFVSTLHNVQTENDDAPVLVENLPNSQDVHELIDSAPTKVEYVLILHSTHSMLSSVDLYFPAAHLIQVAVFCTRLPPNPGLHM